MSEFAEKLIVWQKRCGRHALPWLGTRDPYRRWLAEIMLQQTQVNAVIPYYERFVRRFPSLSDLAAAEEDDVLKLWAGLGYYARGRNLLRCARAVESRGGLFPRTAEELERLPGIGRSTAAAILSACWGVRAPIMDGNAKRVFSRYFGLRRPPSEAAFAKALWTLAEENAPDSECGVYNQALMDMGSGICTKSSPRCSECPVRDGCFGFASGSPLRFPGGKPEKKEKPVLRILFLVLKRNGRVFLEKRTGKGIWKGLRCFPVLEASETKESIEAAYPGAEVTVSGETKHELTHRTLLIRYAEAALPEEGGPRLPEGVWVKEGELASEAVPAPVARYAAGG